MDERTAQRKGRFEVPSHPQETPALPPSPLAQIEPEGPRDVPLPWSTLPLAAVAGLIAGAAQCGVIIAARGGPRLPLSVPAYQGGVDAVHALLVVLGAAMADRLVPSWPRGARWACGMGGAMLAGDGLLLCAAHFVLGRRGGLLLPQVAAVSAWTGVPYALLGLALALPSGSGTGLLWRLPLAGFTAMAYVLGLRSEVLGLIGVPRLVVGPAGSTAEAILGLLLGFVMAERLNAA